MYRIFSLAIIPALLIGITLFVVLIVRAEIAPSSSVEAQSGERRIVFTEKGFVPNVLTISEGEEVVFSSELSRSFWPASDIHPTHGIYPEFDPRRPLRKDEELTMRVSLVKRGQPRGRVVGIFFLKMQWNAKDSTRLSTSWNAFMLRIKISR